MYLNDFNCKVIDINEIFVVFDILIDGCGIYGDGLNFEYLLFLNVVYWILEVLEGVF